MLRPTSVLAFGLLSLVTPLTAHAQTPSSDDIQQAVARGTAWLQADMQKWRDEHQCGACHHAPLALYSLSAAGSGNGAFVKELAHWADSNEAQLVPKVTSDGDTRPTLSLPAVYLSLGLNALPGDHDDLIVVKRRLLQHLRDTQRDDGSWTGPGGRVPVFAPPREVTLLVLVAWDSQRDQFPDFAPMLDKAGLWVQSQPPSDSHQELTLRTMWLADRGEPEQTAPLIERLKRLQQLDGGWKQTAEEPSDAFATGQTLVALRRAGLTGDDPVLQRGVQFLVQSQQPDGSWRMTSRLHPDNNSRAENLNPITYAGSAWGVAGLSAVNH